MKNTDINIPREVFFHLQNIQEEQIPVIVEGRKDKKALQEFGLDNIFTLHLPLFKIVERIQEMQGRPRKEVVILTDLDKEGKALYRRIQHDCIRHGIKINNTLRHFLFQETELSHIEGLPRYLHRLEEKNSHQQFY